MLAWLPPAGLLPDLPLPVVWSCLGAGGPRGILVAYLAEPRQCRRAPVSTGPRAVQSRPSHLARPSLSPTCHLSGDDFPKSFHCGDVLLELVKRFLLDLSVLALLIYLVV